MRVASSNRQENLANVHTSHGAIWLAPGTSHSSLQSIGTGAGQHLVDSHNVVRVGSNSEVETFFAGNLDKVPRIMLGY